MTKCKHSEYLHYLRDEGLISFQEEGGIGEKAEDHCEGACAYVRHDTCIRLQGAEIVSLDGRTYAVRSDNRRIYVCRQGGLKCTDARCAFRRSCAAVIKVKAFLDAMNIDYDDDEEEEEEGGGHEVTCTEDAKIPSQQPSGGSTRPIAEVPSEALVKRNRQTIDWKSVVLKPQQNQICACGEILAEESLLPDPTGICIARYIAKS